MLTRVLILVAAIALPHISFAAFPHPNSEITKAVESICKSLPANASAAQQTVCVELAKDSTEKEKLDFEKSSKEGLDSIISRFQVLAAIVAVGIPIWLAYFSSRSEREARKANEELQFQLKAAEIAMNARDSNEVKVKADLLTVLFPTRLPENFTAKLDKSLGWFGPGQEMRRELLKMLVEHPDQREATLTAWSLIWPKELPPSSPPPTTGKDKNKQESKDYWLPRLIDDPLVGKNQPKDMKGEFPVPHANRPDSAERKPINRLLAMCVVIRALFILLR